MLSGHRPRSSASRVVRSVAVAALIAFGSQSAWADVAPAEAVPTPPAAEAPAGPPVTTVPPVAPVGGPTLTPDLPAVPAPALETAPTPASASVPQRKPFYRRDWFWGAVGVVVLTAAIVLVATSGSDSSPPSTTLGNKPAF